MSFRFGFILASLTTIIGCKNGGFSADHLAGEVFQASSGTTTTPTPAMTPTPPLQTPTPGMTPTPTPVSTATPMPTPSQTSTPISTPTPVMTPTPTPTPTSTTPAIAYFGRMDFSNAAGPRLNHSGSSMVARFYGTQVSATINSSGQYFVSYVDNQAPKRFAVNGTQKVVLASGLSNGEHKVTLMRDSEGSYNVSQFMGFDFGGGQLLPPENPHPIRMEVIGDSITCGFGVLGTSSSCPFSLDTESAYYSYSQVAARKLGAPPAAQYCISGRGIVRTFGTSIAGTKMTLPKAFPYTLSPLGNESVHGPLYTFPTDPNKQPTVVVVNLGTNDFWDGSEPSTYRSTYIEFVKTIRSKYPRAHIFLAIGAMNHRPEGAVNDIIAKLKAAGDSKVSFLKFDLQQNEPNGIGCQGHPARATTEKMGQKLAEAIRALGL